MKKLTRECAERLKAQGYTHITAIVKKHYNTTYLKIEPIDSVVENGGYMQPAARSCKGYRVGVNENHIPKHYKCIRFMDAVYK